jgi:hypothetical protein
MEHSIRSIFIIFIFFLIVSASILTILRISNNKIKGLNDWIAAIVSCGLGISIIYTSESFFNTTISISLGHLLYNLSFVFSFIGLQKFNNKKIEKKVIYYLVAILIIILTLTNIFLETISAGIVVNSFYLLFFSIFVLFSLIKNNFLIELGEKIFSIYFFGAAVTSVIQIIDNIFNFNKKKFIEDSTIGDFVFLTWGSLACFFYIIGILMIVNHYKYRRLKDKLENLTNFYNVAKENLIYQKKALNLLSYNFLSPLSSINVSNTIIKKEIKNKDIKTEADRIDRSINKLVNITNDTLNNSSMLNSLEKNELTKISVKDLLKKISITYQISYEDYLEKDYSILADQKLFLLLISNFIYNFIKISNQVSNVKIYSYSVSDYVNIKITHDSSLDQPVIFEQKKIRKFINKKFSNNTFNSDLIDEVINKLNVKTEYRSGKKINMLILKFKIHLND